MKKINLVCVLFTVYLSLNGQTVFPGGVANISVWNISRQDASGHYGWLDMINNQFSPTDLGKEINSNTASYFNGDRDLFTVPLKNGKKREFTVFIVYQHIKSNGEQTVWSVDNETGASLIMTTQRLGDLEQYGYINYENESEPQYRIFTYTHSEPSEQEKEKEENLSFKIGKQPADKNIPVSNFRGYIPEIVIYERVLNWSERQRVESYLAMKYGISLSQTFPTSYLNSSGNIIWNANIENKFNSNITTIGRDDRSGLLQTGSTSSREPGLLHISLVKNEQLSNNEFLIWADNGGDLQFIQQNGQWKQTGRKWKMNKIGIFSGSDAVQEFDLKYFSNRLLKNGEHYALMIDHSGSGSFPAGKVSFIEATQKKDKLIFSNIPWFNDDRYSEVFSLVIVPQLFARCEINNPDCGKNNGEIILEINGGTAPYSIQFTDMKNLTKITSINTSDRLYTLTDILSGDYVLQIKDATGTAFSENVRIEDIDTKSIMINSHYILNRGETIHLSITDPGFYKWVMPGEQISYNPEINIEQPGVYNVIMRNINGCESSKRIEITSVNSNFSRLLLFPNPTEDGHFWLDIGLNQAGDVNLQIFNSVGNMISQKKLSGSSYYMYSGSLPQASGLYIIQATSNATVERLKIIKL